MTAFEAPGPKNAGLETPPLPGVVSLISSSYKFLTTGPNATVLYGFVGWLLIPVLISLGSTFIDPAIGDVIDFIAGIALFGLSLWATAAITIVVTGIARPDLAPKDVATSVSELAWRRAPTLLWIGLLSGLLQFFGFLLLIIPGIIFTVWFAFAETEAVLSGAGTFVSLEQSRERTRGHFLAILWRLFTFTALLTLAIAIVIMPVMMAGGITDPMVVLTSPPAWLNAFLSVIEILITPLILTYELHLYFALRNKIS